MTGFTRLFFEPPDFEISIYITFKLCKMVYFIQNCYELFLSKTTLKSDIVVSFDLAIGIESSVIKIQLNYYNFTLNFSCSTV